jgi:hypothetical protein
MRNVIILLALIIVGCHDPGPNSNPPAPNEGLKTEVLILELDYQTMSFLGGVEMEVDRPSKAVDSLPILVNYISSGDFGNITLYYSNEDNAIFDGSIVWNGTGEMTLPEDIEAPENFSLLPETLNFPDESRFQFIHYKPEDLDLETLWSGMADLQITWQYLNEGSNIGIFLYTPSVGVGDPNDWRWFIFMSMD